LEGAGGTALVVATGRGVEGQLAALLGGRSLRDQVDRLVTALAASLRGELAELREEVEDLREQIHDPSTARVIDQMLRAAAPWRMVRSARGAQTRLTELAQSDGSIRRTHRQRASTSWNGGWPPLPAATQSASNRAAGQRLRDLRVELGEVRRSASVAGTIDESRDGCST
jgi:hypothetical protein